MNSDSIPEFIQVFSKNIHLFVPALVLSFVEIGCSIYRTDLEAGIQVGIQYGELYYTIVISLFSLKRTFLAHYRPPKRNISEFSTQKPRCFYVE